VDSVVEARYLQTLVMLDVQAGFLSRSALLEGIGPAVAHTLQRPAPYLTASLTHLAEREIIRRDKLSKNWPKVTHCDALDQAFLELNQSGIVALQAPHFDNCGTKAEARNQMQGLVQASKSARGFAYYNGQDLMNAIAFHGLMIGFEPYAQSGPPSAAISIGRAIASGLGRHGFKVHWDGTAETKLFIKRFNWRRRRPEIAVDQATPRPVSFLAMPRELGMLLGMNRTAEGRSYREEWLLMQAMPHGKDIH
jgi:hypothetical protein